MDEKILLYYREKYSSLPDSELIYEVQLFKNDSSFLFRDEDLELFHYFERERALGDELKKRGAYFR